MTDRTTIRLSSFALAALVTWSVFSGIDTLALQQHAAAMEMSQAPPASQVAVTGHAPRS